MRDYRVAYVLEDDGEPLAVFLDSLGHCTSGNVMSYARVDEHSDATVDYVRSRPLAQEADYQKLHTCLTRRYGSGPDEPVNLVIDQSGLSALKR
ncbi:hypothetical protein [Mycolicibacterium aubagnense]|uniref:Uncharacterized protein n=1 Tax=Mycolicibacterium aubagnense TaxID=319707 RepID=A0ABM7IMD6_9MYCO|nr:hypothetical protein [Mycolicibacterium aubagnense]TLH48567.1 hypothetical protein C1S80_29755 [Mycolicibacterium aubagnense]BBX87970.1 hypothetical protein MAUB_58430 [Mycolicibacterium aubagnense]